MTMSFSPLPLVAWYQSRARRAAGLSRVSDSRVRVSMAAAPFSMACMSRSLEGGGKEPDGGQFGGAAADPVPHGEAGDPALFNGDLVELAAFAGDGDGLAGELDSLGHEGLDGLKHAVAGFGRAAGL
jgi:hypothetical protein